jgi:hypothetical protein
MVFAPDQTAGGTAGANTSPKGTLDGKFAGLVMSGAYTGTVAITNATVTITGGLTLQGGELGGANNGGTLVLDTAASGGTSTFGSMRPGANPVLDTTETTITGSATQRSVLNVQGPGSLNTFIANFGSLNFRSGGQGYTVNGPNLTNKPSGIVDLQGDGITFGPALNNFINYGTFKKSAGGGTSTWSGIMFTNYGWFFLNSGTVKLDAVFITQAQYPDYSQPWTELNGGSLQVTDPYILKGGWLDGVGTITGELDNGDPNSTQGAAGIVHPGLLNNGQTPGSGGQLNIIGNFTQTGSGTLWIDVQGWGPSGIGYLKVQGTATLDGTLHVYRYDTDNVKPTGGYLNFLQWQNVSGDFNNIVIDNNSWTVSGVNYWFLAAEGYNFQNAYSLVVQ